MHSVNRRWTCCGFPFEQKEKSTHINICCISGEQKKSGLDVEWNRAVLNKEGRELLGEQEGSGAGGKKQEHQVTEKGRKNQGQNNFPQDKAQKQTNFARLSSQQRRIKWFVKVN